MQITSLRVIDGVRASGCRSVVTRRRVGEIGEGERARVHQRGRKPPGFVGGPGGRILVVEGFMAQSWPGKECQYGFVQNVICVCLSQPRQSSPSPKAMHLHASRSDGRLCTITGPPCALQPPKAKATLEYSRHPPPPTLPPNGRWTPKDPNILSQPYGGRKGSGSWKLRKPRRPRPPRSTRCKCPVKAKEPPKRLCGETYMPHECRKQWGRRGDSKFTYLSWSPGAASGFPAVAVCEVEAVAVEPAAICGNCCLKLARRSSPGFCELVLLRANSRVSTRSIPK